MFNIDYKKFPGNCTISLLIISVFYAILYDNNFNNKISKEKLSQPYCNVKFCLLAWYPYTVVRKEPESHTNFYREPEPHKNDAALQHCSCVHTLKKKIMLMVIRYCFWVHSPHLTCLSGFSCPCELINSIDKKRMSSIGVT
jgi:hypothetical protein